MDDLTIRPEILKTVRKARKLGRSRLARLSGLTERQISRLEGATPIKSGLQSDTILRVATALNVPAGVLAGTIPLNDDDLSPASKVTCTNGCCG